MQTLNNRSLKRILTLSFLSVLFILINGGCEYFLPNKPPFVKKLIPADSAAFTIGQIAAFRAEAYDADGSVEYVAFTPSNGVAYLDSVSPYDFYWNTSGLKSGKYLVEIKAVDDKDEHYIITVPIFLQDTLDSRAGFNHVPGHSIFP